MPGLQAALSNAGIKESIENDEVAVPAIELVVFDIAGTLIEDTGQVIKGFSAAFGKHDIQVSDAEIRTLHGASKREVFKHYIERQFGPGDPENSARIDRAYGDFRQILEDTYEREGVRAIAGAASTLKWLHDHGIKIALNTGFYRKVIEIIIRSLGWHEGFVDAIICGDEVPRGRPAPYMIFRAMEATGVMDVRRVVAVGDTPLDLLAGMHAGIRGVVGVLSGSHGIEDLGRVHHTHIIPSVAGLPALLESGFG
jgi:phosphonatase-like hydrolase